MEYETGGPHDDASGSDVIGLDAPVQRGSRRRGVAIAAGAAILVVGGGAAALAAGTSPSGSPSPSSSPAPSAGASGTESPAAPGKGSSPTRGRYGPGLLGGALHGRLTVPGSGSTYEDVLVQRGTVTAVTPTSLAVRSADGYAHTYTLTAGTVIDGKKGDASSLAVNDTVGVLAGVDSTARFVQEAGRHRVFPQGSPSGPPWPEGRVPGRGLPVPGFGEATPGDQPLGGAATGGGSTT